MPPSRVEAATLGVPETRVPAKAFENGRVYRISGWRYWLVFLPIATLLDLYYRSLRIRIDEESLKAAQTEHPVLAIISHNRSLVSPAIVRPFRKLSRFSCLVSPSKMAAWEAAFFEFLGMRNIRGSSSRRSIQATREMIRAFREEKRDLGLSPDGPKGPCYSFQRGAAMMARQTDGHILFCSASSKTAWRPKTWDRHFVPLPFSKVHVKFRLVKPYSAHGFADDAEAAEVLQRHLLEITDDPF